MNEPTISEKAFERFCAAHGIACERVPTAAVMTPDYEIMLGGHKVIVEIKQIDPNSDEKREMEEFAAKGWVVGGKGLPGDRVRAVISHANKQIKRRTHGILPSLLVFYENVPHTLHTASYCILVAMYGLQQLNLSVPSDPKAPIRLDSMSFGDERKMTPTCNTSTSAVAVLRSHDPANCTLDVYHNVYARVPLAPAAFAGLPVRQYTLPLPGDQRFQYWIEIGASSDAGGL